MDAKDLALLCLGCPNPFCERFCPAGNHIAEMNERIKSGDLKGASEILYSTNPFPEITSSVCDHERQCLRCVKGIKGEPVHVPQIEASLASSFPRDLDKKQNCGKKAALIGAGIANLSAAWFLSKGGWAVDIFEKDGTLGGAIVTGIPSFRFDKTPLQGIEHDLSSLGVRFHYRTEIGKQTPLSSLLGGYDAVLASLGAGKDNPGPFAPRKGIIPGLNLLRAYNEEKATFPEYSSCFVWGGGNVAMDCARALRRLGKKVTVIYRRSQKEMPANECEVLQAQQEGVSFLFLHNVSDVVAKEDGSLKALKVIAMELGEKDESGRASFHPIPDSESHIPCDLLVPAIGQRVDLSVLGIPFEKGQSHKSSLPKLYLAGDCYLGPKNVAACIKDGREAAFEIMGDRIA